MADEKPKEGVKTENNNHINFKVAGQDGSVLQFKIKRHTPLRKLMKAYCERQSEMEDEDTVDVFWQQTGGVL
ncbi:small ubiquitin-related modifier 2-like [Dugong dugon]